MHPCCRCWFGVLFHLCRCHCCALSILHTTVSVCGTFCAIFGLEAFLVRSVLIVNNVLNSRPSITPRHFSDNILSLFGLNFLYSPVPNPQSDLERVKKGMPSLHNRSNVVLAGSRASHQGTASKCYVPINNKRPRNRHHQKQSDAS